MDTDKQRGFQSKCLHRPYWICPKCSSNAIENGILTVNITISDVDINISDNDMCSCNKCHFANTFSEFKCTYGMCALTKAFRDIVLSNESFQPMLNTCSLVDGIDDETSEDIICNITNFIIKKIRHMNIMNTEPPDDLKRIIIKSIWKNRRDLYRSHLKDQQD